MDNELLKELLIALSEHLQIKFVRTYDGTIKIYKISDELPRESSEVHLK